MTMERIESTQIVKMCAGKLRMDERMENKKSYQKK